MRKAALLISLVIASAVAGGSFAYGWYSVTNPSTRENSKTEAVPTARADSSISNLPQTHRSIAPETQSDERSIEQQLSVLVNENGQVSLTLDELQLNQLINDALLSQPNAAQILANARSLETTIKGELIETGTVLNLSELPQEGLPADIQAGLAQLISVAPMLANRDIYFGVIARPRLQDGRLQLAQDLKFKLGQFTLPLSDVADQIGISTSDIEQHLNAVINQQGITLETVEILNDQLVITGTQP